MAAAFLAALSSLEAPHVSFDAAGGARVPWHAASPLSGTPGPQVFSLRAVLAAEQADELVRLVARAQLDLLPDSVDGEPTHELYLEADRLGTADALPGRMEARAALRAQAVALLAAAKQRILAEAQRRYPELCGDGCAVSQSFVRRYAHGARRRHPMHFDIRAGATVVVGLSEQSADFGGGLYVSGGGGERRWLPIRKGDAVMHQSDLLHGVDVTSGTRWSWVLWLRDAEGGDPAGWHAAEAARGEAVPAYLMAHRDGASRRLEWLRASAKAGFPRAMNELGVLLAVEPDSPSRSARDAGTMWLRRAARAQEPDAHYNLGLLSLRQELIDGDAAISITPPKDECADAGQKKALRGHIRSLLFKINSEVDCD